MSENRMTSADAIDQEILSDLAKGVKVETIDKYGSIVNAIVEKSKEMRYGNSGNNGREDEVSDCRRG